MSLDDACLPLSPLTGSSRVRRVAGLPTSKLIADWRGQFGIDITNELNAIPEVAAYRCNDTGLVFFWPPSLAGSAELYAELQRVEGYYRSGKWEHDFAITELNSSDVVLEVGSGTGEFVARAMRVTKSVTGLEISEAAVNEARSRGLDVRKITLEEWVEQNPGSATVCCAFQVLEHVTRPREFTEMCVRAVRPGGRIIFGTPNAAGYLRHQYDLLDLPPHHMSRWRISTFRSLGRLLHLRLKRWGIEPVQDWGVEQYASSATKTVLGRYLPERIVRGLARRLARTRMRRFLAGHTMCVIFERPVTDR